MNTHNLSFDQPDTGRKFRDRLTTADGQDRAHVSLIAAKTLWFNTGTLCNIECARCYIKSSPTNDRLVYLNTGDVASYLDQIVERRWPVTEIGFTGGEPFMNPDMVPMTRLALARGFAVLILTNAMRPMMRASVRQGLEALERDFPGKMTLRVSLDHYSATENDGLRGAGSYDIALTGMRWLRDSGITMAIAGRTIWGETERASRDGFRALINRLGLEIDSENPAQLVLFPEMDETADVPEITTVCWSLLNKSPGDVMCSSARMVVKRKGAEHPVVLACTLVPYTPEFELGRTLKEAEGKVYLNHPHCARFCVLGGASCSG